MLDESPDIRQTNNRIVSVEILLDIYDATK